jgi:hypothetical protein
MDEFTPPSRNPLRADYRASVAQIRPRVLAVGCYLRDQRGQDGTRGQLLGHSRWNNSMRRYPGAVEFAIARALGSKRFLRKNSERSARIPWDLFRAGCEQT